MGVQYLWTFVKSLNLPSIDLNAHQAEPLTIALDYASFLRVFESNFQEHWYFGLSLPSLHDTFLELFSQLNSRNIIFHFYHEHESSHSNLSQLKSKERSARGEQRVDSFTKFSSLSATPSSPIPSSQKSDYIFNSLTDLTLMRAIVASNMPLSLYRAEGDIVLAQKVAEGAHFGVLSSDSDFIIFENSNWIIQQLLPNWVKLVELLKNNQPVLVNYVSNQWFREYMGLSQSKLIDFSVLLGNDFTKQIINSINCELTNLNGKNRLLKVVQLVKQAENLEEIEEWDRFVKIEPNLPHIRRECVSIFSNNYFSAWDLIDFYHDCSSVNESVSQIFKTILDTKFLADELYYRPTLSFNQIQSNSLIHTADFSIPLYTGCFFIYKYLFDYRLYEFEVREKGHLCSVPINQTLIFDPSDWVLDYVSQSLIHGDLHTKFSVLFEHFAFWADAPNSKVLLLDESLNETVEKLTTFFPGISTLILLIRYLTLRSFASNIKVEFMSISDIVLLVMFVISSYLIGDDDDLIGDEGPERITTDPNFYGIFKSKLIEDCCSQILKLSTIFQISSCYEILSFLDFSFLTQLYSQFDHNLSFQNFESCAKFCWDFLSSFPELTDYIADYEAEIFKYAALVFKSTLNDLFSDHHLQWSNDLHPSNDSSLPAIINYECAETTCNEISKKSWNAILKISDLPIFQKQSELIDAISSNNVVTVTGQTGSGKTTMLPLLLLAMYPMSRVIVTQPRRIAAIRAAERLSVLLGTQLGSIVGYRIKGESAITKSTQIEFQTVGYTLQSISHHPSRASTVDFYICDEVHERSIDCDMTLTMLRRLLYRCQSKLIITSATLQVEIFTKYFSLLNNHKPIPTIDGGSKLYPVNIYHLDELHSCHLLKGIRLTNLEKKSRFSVDYDLICSIIKKVAKLNETILVFLAGIDQIEDLHEQLTQLKLTLNFELEIAVIYGFLSPSEQQVALSKPKTNQSKVVIATNIAESSVTVQGVTSVIDTGFHKTLVHSKGKMALELCQIGKSSAVQRAGRSGRLSPGVCFRLYTSSDYATRPEFDSPEVLTAPLSKVILSIKSTVPGRPSAFLFELPQAPSPGALKSAIKTLYVERCIVGNSELSPLTSFGHLINSLPMDISICRLIQVGLSLNRIVESLLMVAIITCKDIYYQANSLFLSLNHFMKRKSELTSARIGYAEPHFSDIYSSFSALYDFFLSQTKGIVDPGRCKHVLSTVRDLASRILSCQQYFNISNETLQNLEHCVKGEILEEFDPKIWQTLLICGVSQNLLMPKFSNIQDQNLADLIKIFVLEGKPEYKINKKLQCVVEVDKVKLSQQSVNRILKGNSLVGPLFYLEGKNSLADRGYLVTRSSKAARSLLSCCTKGNVLSFPFNQSTLDFIIETEDRIAKRNTNSSIHMFQCLKQLESNVFSIVFKKPKRIRHLKFNQPPSNKVVRMDSNSVCGNLSFYDFSKPELIFGAFYSTITAAAGTFPLNLVLVEASLLTEFLWLSSIPNPNQSVVLKVSSAHITSVVSGDGNIVELKRPFPLNLIPCVNNFRVLKSIADHYSITLNLNHLEDTLSQIDKQQPPVTIDPNSSQSICPKIEQNNVQNFGFLRLAPFLFEINQVNCGVCGNYECEICSIINSNSENIDIDTILNSIDQDELDETTCDLLNPLESSDFGIMDIVEAVDALGVSPSKSKKKKDKKKKERKNKKQDT
ncbi:hypothetical protein P9112_008548 [Eukaryota sp. TZLM1-RC]